MVFAGPRRHIRAQFGDEGEDGQHIDSVDGSQIHTAEALEFRIQIKLRLVLAWLLTTLLLLLCRLALPRGNCWAGCRLAPWMRMHSAQIFLQPQVAFPNLLLAIIISIHG